MAVAETADQHDHDHDHHDHGPFIAHHFDGPEQQFDSGKLGIWIFLVTEVLFFSGLFVAYTLYRLHHPEIFELAHHHLDKVLGCLNTIVLLFSSLTMALAVRSAQTGKNKNCELYLLITMVCATIFLGVKAVEYSHKWDLGIFPKSFFNYSEGHHATGFLGLSPYLIKLSVIPALLLAGFAGWSVIGKLTDKSSQSRFFMGMAIVVAGYFAGVFGGVVYQNAISSGHSSHASVNHEPMMLQAAMFDDADHGEDHEHGDGEEHSVGDHAEGEHAQGDHAAGGMYGEAEYSMPKSVGAFFSIYYCMTGLHAIHIIGGIIALAWIYYRSQQGHWREDYFGPVDYVGLYWHLVDLIWIYLFPLLYLID
jgi:cytochrome c oxidase subunit 3